MAGLITPELEAALGREYPPLTATITEESVRRYCRALGRPWDGRVPHLFLASLGHDQAPPPSRTDGLSGRSTCYPLEVPLQRSVIGGMEWEFARRPRLGETLTIGARYVSIEERQGRASGPMVLTVLEVTFTDADGQRVATQRTTAVRR